MLNGNVIRWHIPNKIKIKDSYRLKFNGIRCLIPIVIKAKGGCGLRLKV